MKTTEKEFPIWSGRIAFKTNFTPTHARNLSLNLEYKYVIVSEQDKSNII